MPEPQTIIETWWNARTLDRADGPAVIERDAATEIIICEEWWSDGTLHRVDGPAVIERDATTGIVTREEWWIEEYLAPPPSASEPAPDDIAVVGDRFRGFSFRE